MIYSIAQALVHDSEPVQTAAPAALRARRQRSRKDIRIALKGQTLYFRSLDDFSFAIESRTSVPTARFDELLEHSPAQLRAEAESIKSVEKNLVDILEDALCDGSACGPSIRGLGLQIYSKDHDWRLLMEALNELSEEYEGYKRLALIKYMQYLGARQEILRLIFTIKNKGGRSSPCRRAGDFSNDIAAAETALFDLSQLDQSEPTENPVQRLPQGEAVRAYALPGHAIEIRMAKYTFKLINDNGWSLCDSRGEIYALADRQNTIGRGSDNDVTLSSEFRNISRRHLIAQPLDDHVVLLTDISSHGTFAPLQHLEH